MSTFNISPQNVIATEHLYYDNPGIMTKIAQQNGMEVLFTHGRSRASYVAGKRQQCRERVSLTSAQVQYSLFQSPLPYTEPVTFSQDNLKQIKPSSHRPLNMTDCLQNAWIWKMYEYAWILLFPDTVSFGTYTFCYCITVLPCDGTETEQVTPLRRTTASS